MNHPIRLIYVSFISPDFDQHSTAQIVRHARNKNRQLDITGVLIFDGLRFCQYLEGPAATLNALATTIRTDPRHLDFSIKGYSSLLGSRLFGDSPLSYAIASEPGDLEQLHTINRETDASAFVALLDLLPKLSADSSIGR